MELISKKLLAAIDKFSHPVYLNQPLLALKRFVKRVIHSLFRIKFFENILLLFVKDKFTDHFLAKIIPPNTTYKDGTYRVVRKGNLILHANLYDYNDWKAFWGLKEVERENLYKMAKNAKIIIDIGVNNGWVLMNLCSMVSGNSGFVYGFEPHPATYEKCIKNVSDSHIGNCKIFNVGCGENEDEMKMIAEKKSNSGQNRIISNECSLSLKEYVNIKTSTLDKQLADIGRIDLIKIDVEGFEMNVLKGGDSILGKYHPDIFLEIDERLLKENNTTPAEILSFLQDKYNYAFTHAFSGKKINVSDDFSGCHLDVICRVHAN